GDKDVRMAGAPASAYAMQSAYRFKSAAISVNGANGMRDIEGKAAREAVSECGQRASFNWASAAWGSSMISAAMLQSLLLLRFRRLSCSPNDSTPQPPNVSTSCVSL